MGKFWINSPGADERRLKTGRVPWQGAASGTHAVTQVGVSAGGGHHRQMGRFVGPSADRCNSRPCRAVCRYGQAAAISAAAAPWIAALSVPSAG